MFFFLKSLRLQSDLKSLSSMLYLFAFHFCGILEVNYFMDEITMYTLVEKVTVIMDAKITAIVIINKFKKVNH